MKKYLILHYGFIRSTPEDMEKWNMWFDSIHDRQIEKGHFPVGSEITKSGKKKLTFGRDSITGYTIITAKDIIEAGNIAKSCPIVDSTRIYEIMSEEESLS